jgi:predicted MFS family arabinose efflux permease
MRLPPVLRVAAFRRLATSYTLNELCWGFGTIALGVLVYDRTSSAVATTALFLATTFAPALLAPALTARLDRLPVRRALPALYLFEAAAFTALAVLATRFWLPAVLVLALADGAVAIVGRALTRAAVAAALAPTGALAEGNKVINVCFAIAFATGPALAGVVTAAAGAAASLGVTAGLFAAMAAVLATSRALPRGHGDADRSWRARLAGGLRYVRDQRAVRAILGGHGLAVCFLSFAVPIEVVYVRDSLGASDSAYGLILGAWGAGTVVSSIVIARVRTARPLVLAPLAACAMGCSYAVMAAAPLVAVAAVASFLGGAGNGMYSVSVTQAIQERLPEEFQARVMGLLESVNAAGYGAGFLAGGAVTALADARIAFAAGGAGVVVAAASIARLLRSGTMSRGSVRPSPAAEPAR